jgi:hypothetical protein
MGGPGEGGKLTCGKYVDWSSGVTPLASWDWRAAGSITPVRDQAGVSGQHYTVTAYGTTNMQ